MLIRFAPGYYEIKTSCLYFISESEKSQEICKTPEKGSVKLTFLPKKEDIDYQEDTLQNLTEEVDALLQQGVKLNDIAILVRKNNVIPIVADYFDKHTSYRIVSDEAFRLDASLAIS